MMDDLEDDSFGNLCDCGHKAADHVGEFERRPIRCLRRDVPQAGGCPCRRSCEELRFPWRTAPDPRESKG